MRPRVRSVLGIGFLSSVSVLCLVWIGCLFLGNPQWEKSIYLFRAHVYPAYGMDAVPIPEGFTGTWHSWIRYGMATECSYKQGVRHGRYEVRYANGWLCKQWTYKDGKRHGIKRVWYPDGVLAKYEVHDDGVFKENATWDRTGSWKSKCTTQGDGDLLLKMRIADGCVFERTYDEAGAIIQTVFRVDGVVVSKEEFWSRAEERKQEVGRGGD